MVWLESALDDLARFWMKTVHRQAITDSADLADDVPGRPMPISKANRFPKDSVP